MYIQDLMKIYRLNITQNLPISTSEAWDFLSDPDNLKTITPDYMGFEILSGTEKKMLPDRDRPQTSGF